MKSTSSLSLAAHGRDLRIDFARGLALWFMLVDHIPHNIVALFTMRNFGFSGAIDVFVFVSGYAAAIQYGKMTLERGFVVAATDHQARVAALRGSSGVVRDLHQRSQL